MRKTTFIFILLLTTGLGHGQTKLIDSLRQVLATVKDDTSRVNALSTLARVYSNSKPDSSLAFSREGLHLAKKINFKRGEAACLSRIATVFNVLGNYPRALELYLEALKIAEEIKDKRLELSVISNLADTYFYSGDFGRSINYSNRFIEGERKLGRAVNMYNGLLNLGDTYEKIGKLDSALFLTKLAYNYYLQDKTASSFGICLLNLGNIYSKMGRPDSAMDFYRPARIHLKENLNDPALTECYLGMANLFLRNGQSDSSLFYAKQAFSIANSIGATDAIMKAGSFLADRYRSARNLDSAFTYQSIATVAKDSLFSQQKANEIQSLSYEETMRQQQIEEEKERSRTQLRQNALIAGLVILLIVAFFLLLNNRQKRKANTLLQSQKEQIDLKANELSAQKEILQQSYSNVELLGEIGRKITSSLSVETIISTVYDNVNALMDASVFGIGIYHDETKQIDFPATYENGIALPAYSNSIFEENRFASLCFISAKEIVMGDLQIEYKNYLQNVPVPKQGQQPVSLIYLPLKAKEKMFGVITVQSFQKNAYSDYHIYMLRTIAIYAAIALENAESYKKLNQTLDSLTKTQSQLIQSEKMASLGELTAGIAHEIQNPLNFVNNFSEINKELTVELKAGLATGNMQLANEIADDIRVNSEKINHHGKRADAIVKGMLQHSRTSTGQKEPTDINALADEYLRLAFHGLRAKDKTFNATTKTNFDNDIGRINVAQQEMGRVILNLINNAFYTVDQKRKKNGDGYNPTVTISTKKENGKVEIKVTDNGNGIPQKVLDKIFQPFFTTKPTGQGTGLGLSLAYDIITKGHGGELKVQTKEGDGSEFIIRLPAN